MTDRLIRIFDLSLSGLALVLLSPVLLAVMLVLRFTGERDVFFVQQRVGRNGRTFGLLKFATMQKNSPNIGTGVLTVRNDPRILPVGRLLRKTKINELPQIINVLRGDMSLIGPRPQTRAHFDVFPDWAKSTLMTVRPGLSGSGSIVFRDEENVMERSKDKTRFYADVISPYKAEVEIWYIERRSVRLYLLLIGLTALVVLFPRTNLYRRMLPDLPPLPDSLKGL